MFYMLYMVISLKSKVRRLETRRLAFAVKKLARKGFGRRNKTRHAIHATQELDGTVPISKAKPRAAGFEFDGRTRGRCECNCRHECNQSEAYHPHTRRIVPHTNFEGQWDWIVYIATIRLFIEQ